MDERVDMTGMATHADGSLDIILCSDDRKAMREMRRVLKPDGFAIVLVPLVIGLDEAHEDPNLNTPELRWKILRHGRPYSPIRQARFYRTARG